MIIVPLQPVPSQTLRITLSGQACNISVFQKGDFLFFSLSINGNPIITTIIALNRVLLVREPYLGVIGDFAFCDMQGTNDPEYAGLGSRYMLVYLAPGDY